MKVWDCFWNWDYATVTTHVADIGFTPSSSVIALNDDDDNTNGTPDYLDGDTTVQNENDLVELQLSATLPGPYRKIITLSVGSGITVWSSATRGTRLATGPGSKSWSCPPPTSVWLEGTGVSVWGTGLSLSLQYCGCPKTANVMVYDVDLEASPTGSNPSLPAGQICLNAQDTYRRTTWRAIVQPATVDDVPVTASVQTLTGDISLESKDGSSLSALKHADEFWVVGNGPEAQAGAYSIKLTCNSCAHAIDIDGDYCTKFVYVVNSNTVPTVRQSSQGAYTNTSAGGDHDGGRGIVTWSRSDTDSTYLEAAGIGDETVDVQPNIGGWARTIANATNDLEFYAGMQDIGYLQVAMIPQEVDFSQRLAVQTDISLSAGAATTGYATVLGSVSLGYTVRGVIKFSVGSSAQLNGRFGCVGGIGLYWNTSLVDADEYADTWQGTDPFMRGESHSLAVSATCSAETLVGQSLPFNIPLGFAGGVSFRENDVNPAKLGSSYLYGMALSVAPPQYSILQ
jgi:hypothetical protein